MNRVIVKAQEGIQYPILFTDDVLDVDCKLLLSGRDAESRKGLLVVDAAIQQRYGARIAAYFGANAPAFRLLQLEGGERNKTVSAFLRVFDAINLAGLNRRNEPVIIIGGGVVSDVAAFAASCYRRGIPHIKVPTTLMGYVDASVGIKNGVNYRGSKNRMGSFFAPHLVILDKSFMASQSSRQIANGLGEILKIAVIKNEGLFASLERHAAWLVQNRFQDDVAQQVLQQAITDMVAELAPNLFEDQLERRVDFGHTFSLAFEMAPNADMLHGEAVAMDVLVSCQLACQRRLMSQQALERVRSVVRSAAIAMRPDLLSPPLLWDSLNERVRHRNGWQRLPLPGPIGHCTFVNDLDYREVDQACRAVVDLLHD